MDLRKVTSILATVAPGLATAVGGPLAGVAAQAITGALTGEATPDLETVERALTSAKPEDLVKLKAAEAEFARAMKDADIDLEGIAADDRADARARQVKTGDNTPAYLGFAIILGFFGALSFVFFVGLPDAGSEIVLIMIGVLGTMTTQVANYFFGSSVGSKTKEATIAQLRRSR